MPTFTTRTDVLAEITTAIEVGGAATAAEYDLDAVADETYTFDTDAQVFVPTATAEEFWASVARHAR